MTLTQELRRYKRIFVVYDRNVEDFATQLAGGKAGKPGKGGTADGGKYPMLAITADEEHKTAGTVLDICRWLLDRVRTATPCCLPSGAA